MKVSNVGRWKGEGIPGRASYISTIQPMFARAIATRQPTGPAPTTTSFFVMVGVAGSSFASMAWRSSSHSILTSHLTLAGMDISAGRTVSRHEKMFTFHSTPLPWSWSTIPRDTFSEPPNFIDTRGPVIFIYFQFSYEPEDAGTVMLVVYCMIATLAGTGVINQ
jgi:hypothetical protein